VRSDFVTNLIEVGALIEQRQTLEEGLGDLAALAACSLDVGRCTVMLLREHPDSAQPELKVCSHYGDLPEAAYQQGAAALPTSIAGQVLTSGEAVLINDVRHSPLADLARQGDEAGDSLMSAPIFVADRPVGVINVSRRRGGEAFTQRDFNLFKVFAMFIGKSIHVLQLQKLSDSRLLQMAELLERRGKDDGHIGPISPDPAQLARIVAKSFYRELTLAGFGPRAIMAVASEVLGQLNEHLDRHRSRAEREDGGRT